MSKQKVAFVEWVDVKDSLPKDKHAVNVWCPGNKCVFTASLEYGKWIVFGAYDQEVYRTVTHWKETPKPPGTVEAIKEIL